MLKRGQQIETKTRQQWIQKGRNNKKQYVFYEGLCLDMGYFKNLHPGGSQVIRNYIFKDVTQILFTVFPHNKQRVNKILERYTIGRLDQPLMQKIKMQGTILKSGKFLKQNSIMKKSVQFPSQIKKLASQKQRLQQSRRASRKKKQNNNKNKNSNSKFKNGSRMILSLSKGKDSNKKCLDAKYLSSLKPQYTEIKSKQLIVSESNSVIVRNKKQSQSLYQGVTITQVDSSESIEQDVNTLTESTYQMSINDGLMVMPDGDHYLDECSQQEMLGWCLAQQTLVRIRVPVMTVRFDRVW